MYCTSPTCKPDTAEVIDVPIADRWRIYYRLQELQLACGCTTEGQLWVEIHTTQEAILVRSTVSAYLSSRQNLVVWLQRCWSL
ncbi:MAG: hypothetical protein HC921_11350 [Synechococcaceae cyanobacterium SM2_3_1]|nr:hypothetical protein [Synechococcaceae cyanobacterium SM2_3_1]